MICPECESKLLPGARFCHQCGWDSKLAAAGKASSSSVERPAWKRWSMSVTLVLSALLVVFLLVVPRGDAEPTLLAGQAAPDFDLQALDGGHIRLADLKGKPVIINFWATWCTPCRKEMPEFQKLYDTYKDQGLQMIGINVGESRIGVAEYRDKLGVKFPILLDTKETAQDAYKILPLPATFFVDRNGTLKALYQYQMSSTQIESEVQRLMAH